MAMSLGEHVSNVLHWSSPVVTFSFLGGFNMMYIILFVMHYSLLTLMGWAAFTCLLVCSPLALLPSTYPPDLSPLDSSKREKNASSMAKEGKNTASMAKEDKNTASMAKEGPNASEEETLASSVTGLSKEDVYASSLGKDTNASSVSGSAKEDKNASSKSSTFALSPTELSSPSNPPSALEIISMETVNEVVTHLSETLNDLTSKVRHLLLWKNPTLSLIALFSLAIFSHTTAKLQITLPLAIYLATHITLLATFLHTFHKHTLLALYRETKLLLDAIPKIEAYTITHSSKNK